MTGCFSWGLEPHTARAVAQSEASEDRPAGWEASVFGGWSSLQMVGDGQTSPSESWDGWSVGCDGGETDLSSVHFPVFCYELLLAWVDLSCALGMGCGRKGQMPPSLQASQWQWHQALVPPQPHLTSGTMGIVVLVLP